MESDSANGNLIDAPPDTNKKIGGIQDVDTNRQTLNTVEFSDSQPRLVSSERSLPVLDLGEQQFVSTEPIPIPRGRAGRTTPCSSPAPTNMTSVGSPCGSGFGLPIPSPIITKRNRTPSTCERAMDNPIDKGVIRYFSRTKGHGFITNENDGEDIFVHISDIENEYIPRVGDAVTYRVCPIPPKLEKLQAIHVRIVHFTPDVHLKWDSPIEETEKSDAAGPSNLVT